MKICLNMIVKNEAAIIERCLRSVMPWIHYWVIADTGSTDGTQEKIKHILKDIPGELHERPWVHFAHNRNDVLGLSKGKGDYILLIDADEYLEYPPAFQLPQLDKDTYGIIHRSDNIDFQRSLLLNNRIEWEWVGVIHEEPQPKGPVSVGFISGIVNICLQDGNRSQDPKKFLKDLKILEKALEQEPDNIRYVFYLAETHLILGHEKEALAYYEQRSRMGGAEQEIFWSLYQVGRLQQRFNLPPEIFLRSYCAAYQSRPSRVEPLFFLINYYIGLQCVPIAYCLAKEAIALSIPADAHYVEAWMYEWGVLLQFVKSAYAIGKKDEAKKAAKRLLSVASLPIRYQQEVAAISK